MVLHSAARTHYNLSGSHPIGWQLQEEINSKELLEGIPGTDLNRIVCSLIGPYYREEHLKVSSEAFPRQSDEEVRCQAA